MPNWCSTQIHFVGNAEDIADFHHKIIEYTSREFIESGFGEDWLGNILCGFGMEERINSNINQIRCRGSLYDISAISMYDNNNLVFDIQTETAWVPMIQMWYEIIHKHYDNRIDVYWIAEELGCGIYETNDINWFNTDHYHIGWGIEAEDEYGGEYCNSPNEVADVINSLIAKYKLDTEQITEDDINKADDKGSDFFLNGEDWNISCLILREVNDADMD